MKIEWKITRMEFSEDPVKRAAGVIVRFHFQVTATAHGFTVSRVRAVDMPQDRAFDDTFVDHADLTEKVVLSWIDPEIKRHYEDLLREDIRHERVTAARLPWSSP